MAVKTKAVSERETEAVTVDTTVGDQGGRPPTDGHLLMFAIERLHRAADTAGGRVLQSYLHLGHHAPAAKSPACSHTGYHKRTVGHQRTRRAWVGRLLRDIERKTSGKPAAGDSFLATAMERVGRLYRQKPDDKQKLYDLHAPVVDCGRILRQRLSWLTRGATGVVDNARRVLFALRHNCLLLGGSRGCRCHNVTGLWRRGLRTRSVRTDRRTSGSSLCATVDRATWVQSKSAPDPVTDSDSG